VTSLRRQLLMSLWLSLALVGSVCAAFTYLQSRQETNALLDYQMEQVAALLGAQSFSAASPAAIYPRSNVDHDIEDDFIFNVRDAAGNLLYTSQPDVPLPPLNWLGFRTILLAGADYRVFSAASGKQHIAVAQLMELRQETAAGAAFTALLPVVILIPVLGLVIGLVIRRQLQPLRVIAQEVASRPPLAMAPLSVHGLPSELRPLIDEINRLLKRLQDALQLEQRFIADAAHALRTPLAALQLQADVLDGSDDEIERGRRLTALRAGIRRAVRLSNHLLASAHTDPVTSAVRVHSDLDAALTEIWALYQPAAVERQVNLVLDAHSAATVPGDARHLALLAGNLLDNALRYTPAGSVVTLKGFADGDGAHILVEDAGPGLAEAELEKVFERFYRAPGDSTEGSGLGLATVRSIASRLGGTVTLKNRVDRSGLVACITLPWVKGTEQNSPRESAGTKPI
jgi:two-component system OmpR family sensor kinase